MNRLRIGLASIVEIDALWPSLTEGMAKACKRCNSAWTPGELWQMCRSGQAFLCIVHDGQSVKMASIWRFETARPGVSFRCIMMYGHGMANWLEMAREYIVKLASENGAVALVAEGRSGWAKIFGAAKIGRDYEVSLNG